MWLVLAEALDCVSRAPHGEHDCAVLQVGALRILWKIDLYEEPYVGHKTGKPPVTRVLTIMLAEEY